jgi:hypothetical protein
LRFILSELLTERSGEFDSINDVIPEVHRRRDSRAILPHCGRLIKTHEPYRNDYQKAIYLARDVRDVVLSLYAREKALRMLEGLYKGFDDYLPALLQGRANHWGAWDKHVRSWLGSPLANSGRLLLIRFEDLRANPNQLLAQIVDFLGVTVDERKIAAAVTNNSIEQMRAKENRARTTPTSSQVSWIGKGGQFVRDGSIRGWRDKLTPEQVAIIERHAGTELYRLGYSTGAAAETLYSQRQAG